MEELSPASKDSEVFKRVEELLYVIYPTLINYPKVEHYNLCSDIKHSFFNLLSFLSQADSVPSKRKTYLQEADGHLQTLKVLYKLSKHQKCISKGFFKEVDMQLSIIDEQISKHIKKTSRK